MAINMSLKELYSKNRKWDELGDETGWLYVVARIGEDSEAQFLYIGQTTVNPRQRITQHCHDNDLIGRAINSVAGAEEWRIVMATPGECALEQNQEPHDEKDHITELFSAERYLIDKYDPLFNWGERAAKRHEIPDDLMPVFAAYAPHIWGKDETEQELLAVGETPANGNGGHR